MNNHCDKLCQVYIKWHVILLCYFELLTYFFLWHHHIDRIINLEHYITLLMLLSCTALTFLYFCIFRSWNSNPYSPHVLITVSHSKPCWYSFEPILWTCTTNWTQINKLAVLSQLLITIYSFDFLYTKLIGCDIHYFKVSTVPKQGCTFLNAILWFHYKN